MENRTACVPCREGFYNWRGGSMCEGCPPGMESDTTRTRCTACVSGIHNPVIGGKCISCSGMQSESAADGLSCKMASWVIITIVSAASVTVVLCAVASVCWRLHRRDAAAQRREKYLEGKLSELDEFIRTERERRETSLREQEIGLIGSHEERSDAEAAAEDGGGGT